MSHRTPRPPCARPVSAGRALMVGVFLAARAQALDAPPQPAAALPEILVVSATPVPGLRVDADKIPGNVQSLFSAELAKNGPADLVGAMNTRLGSVNINDTLADPFQPDILYRGFEASPVLGTPQGMAVYQNGVRINEAFGDTVNWDLIPDIAIDRVDLMSSSPLFGLNALGGAMSVTMKNGFTYQGGSAELSGGSFNQRAGSADFGVNHGIFGFYAAARVLRQEGWRLFAHDSLQQYYMNVSLHDDGPTIDLSYSRANTLLNGQGAAPIQSLAISTKNVFTGPQNNLNNMDFATLNASYDFTDTMGIQSVAYFRDFRQNISNGNSTNYVGCAVMDALCQSDGTTPLTTSAGALIPDITHGGTALIGENDFESTRSLGWGGSVQFSSTENIVGHGNSFAVGATVDTAETRFISGTELGVITASLTVLPSPYFVDTPEGTGFSATPVVLNTNNKYYGLFATDTVDVTSALSITASGRYNVAKVDLSDRRGTALNGNNRFTHFNPAVGATYKITPTMTVYAGYSTNNRAPTPSEIECSDPRQPCLLPTNLAGDPPNLKQVVAHTYEAGVRGRVAPSSRGGGLTWNVSVFHTNLDEDIYGIATSVSTGFFQNIGSTRRQGFETGLAYENAEWRAYGQFSYVDATFRSPLLLNSPSNPFQDMHGDIQVLPGDHLPLIPKTRVKLGADYAVIPPWSIGASLTFVGGSFYKGDESNQNPELPSYMAVSLRSSYKITRQIQIFANVQNLLDKRYSTFGLYSDPTGVNAPGVPPAANSNDPGADNRFQSPAMPRAYFGGIEVKF